MKKRQPKKFPEEGSGKGKNFIQYSNVAFRMIVIILAGVFGGIKLDEWVGLKQPLFTLFLTLFSVAAAMYIIIKEASQK